MKNLRGDWGDGEMQRLCTSALESVSKRLWVTEGEHPSKSPVENQESIEAATGRKANHCIPAGTYEWVKFARFLL